MKRFISVLALCSVSFGSNLDSLVTKSSQIKYPGFFSQKVIVSEPKAIQPLKNVPKIAHVTKELPIRSAGYITHHEYDGDKEELNAKLSSINESIDKITIVLDNLQKQAKTHSDALDTWIKIIELLGGLITVITGVVGSIHINKTNKLKRKLSSPSSKYGT
jgi:hypothetical protein